jgi:hypothetical protein
MKRFLLFCFLLLVILILIDQLYFPGSGDSSEKDGRRGEGVWVEFLHYGSPAPATFWVDHGECEKIEEYVLPDGVIFQRADCGIASGMTRFEVRCHDPDLPVAFQEVEIKPGGSVGISFEHVCSSTAEEIHAENSRVRNEGRSARWSGRAAPRSPAAATATSSQLPVMPPENSLKKPDSSRK